MRSVRMAVSLDSAVLHTTGSTGITSGSGGTMKRQLSTVIRAAAGAAVLAAGLSLAGCAGSPAASPSPLPTVTVTATATATPTPAAASPDDPMTPLAAWTACAVLGAQEYLVQNPGTELRPYDGTPLPTRNPDGSYQAIVAMTLPAGAHDGVASNVAICDIGGTLGSPKLLHFVLKDV